jgi:hypothetical protein
MSKSLFVLCECFNFIISEKDTTCFLGFKGLSVKANNGLSGDNDVSWLTRCVVSDVEIVLSVLSSGVIRSCSKFTSCLFSDSLKVLT